MSARSDERRVAAETFYGALAQHADSARRVGWESSVMHALRLATIVEALAPVDVVASVLDVGCGEGALLDALRAAGFKGRYRGEEVRAEALQRAATRADQGEFAVCDGFAGGPSASAVVCSGTLNTVSGGDHDAEVAGALSALWERTEDVLVVDLAVLDRHAPGVGIARADLAKAWAHARTLAPIVTVHEDVVPGEACIVLARSRARAFTRRLSAGSAVSSSAAVPGIVAEALFAAGEPAQALALARPDALLLRGQALIALGRPQEALPILRAAEATHGDAARLAQAPALWRTGDRRGAEALLTELATRHDEARAHLFELIAGRKDWARAATIVASIEDPWVRRELMTRLPR